MTIAPRWRKVLRDIGETPGRTALAVVSMAAGIFGVGAILTSYSILNRELARTYIETRPASAVLTLDRVDEALVASVRRLPGIIDAEARPMIFARVRVRKDEWVLLVLFVVRDFGDLRIDRFERESGAWPPADDGVLLERACLSVARAAVGDTITMANADGAEQSLRVAGTVHAAGLAPGWMDHVVSGFVTWKSIARTNGERSDLRVIAANDQAVSRMKSWLQQNGRRVVRIDASHGARHPHADQMDSFLFLLGAFGALTLLLSGVLVANMIHALLTEQLRQVGVMKAIGATTPQIASLYLGQVSILAMIALCIGVPLGVAAGRGYADFSASILNAVIANRHVPFWALALQLVVGIGVPLIVSVAPVMRASRITIHAALSDDCGRRPYGTRAFDRWLSRIAWLPRPLMLSLRTTFHRRGRLLLTISTLAAGGAVFVSALNVAAAWSHEVAADNASRRYDIEVRLSRAWPISQLATVAAVPDIRRVEYWPEATAGVVRADGRSETRARLTGPDPDTPLLRLPLSAGRWLSTSEENSVVINQLLMSSEPSLRIGGPLVLRVGTRTSTWRVAGVVKDLAHGGPAVYASRRAVLRATGQAGDVAHVMRVVTRGHDAAAQMAAARGLERGLALAGIGVAQLQTRADRRKAIEDHLVIIESALIFAASLVVMVGCLGLTTTLTLNVVERTREIGILGAIGATPRTIARYVVFEGLLMGVLSWCLAVVAAAPATLVIGNVAGRIFTKSPLAFFMSPRAVVTWLVLVTALAAVSSFYPARRASRLVVREALAHE